MIGFVFRLFSPDGDDLGTFQTAVPNWHPGEEFVTGDGRQFRIVAIVPTMGGESRIHGLWEVEPVAHNPSAES